jgi:RHS repeat-associated protein
MLLGTFTMAPGQNHRVELTDLANGTVTADAVKFVPEQAVKTATWTISVGTTGSYKVYAKWPAASTHATDAPYTVTHAGGASTVTVNQRVNGGQWNLLGTWSFDSGTDYKVELSDAVAAGKVAADAIYIAPAGAPTSDAFTWTPAIPGSGTYQVYARWPASSANTGAAQYTVTHAGGTSNATLNQKQDGGSWVLLGSWSFAPGAGHEVTLAAAAEGTTIADALLFVAAGAQPANLLYVHADHLGSPQKLTDASQATVWDGVFDPFGEEVAVSGLAAMQLRFPGQYADAETGYSYNYFRDYDPRLGRYLQSDPIGLEGGFNTFSYVLNRPTGAVDPLGLYTRCMPGTIQDMTSPECQGPSMGGGGGAPSDGGGGAGAGIGAAIIGGIVAGSSSSSQDAAQRQAEYDAYKKRCNETPPPGLDKCEKWRWLLQRNQDCRNMRQAWDDKWQPGRHEGDIRNLDKAIENLKQKIAKECCGK